MAYIFDEKDTELQGETVEATEATDTEATDEVPAEEPVESEATEEVTEETTEETSEETTEEAEPTPWWKKWLSPWISFSAIGLELAIICLIVLLISKSITGA